MEYFLTLLVSFQLFLIFVVKTRIDGPFKVLTLYSLAFLSLRWVYAEYIYSKFNISGQDLTSTFFILFIFVFCLSLVALTFELDEKSKVKTKFNLSISKKDLIAADLFLYLSIAFTFLGLLIRYLKFGFIFQTDYMVDVWAGLYFFKIPMWSAIVALIFNLHLKKYKKALISLSIIFILIAVDGERAPAFFFIFSLGVYLLISKKISWKTVSLTALSFPIIFYILTVRRFSDLSTFGILASLFQGVDTDLMIELLNWSYGRYYILESTFLLFDGINLLREEYYSFTYFFQRIFPFLDIAESGMSLSQLACSAISENRWEPHVSCMAFYPALMYFDSGIIGLFFSIFSSLALLYFWVKAHRTTRLIIFSLYAWLFPKIMFFLNWTLASFFEIIYYLLYIFFVLGIAKFLSITRFSLR
tara:strand:+ start:2197 stop:3444 length:1248 start_codon:yes stop_codon:yes gene_type:complete